MRTTYIISCNQKVLVYVLVIVFFNLLFFIAGWGNSHALWVEARKYQEEVEKLKSDNFKIHEHMKKIDAITEIYDAGLYEKDFYGEIEEDIKEDGE